MSVLERVIVIGIGIGSGFGSGAGSGFGVGEARAQELDLTGEVGVAGGLTADDAARRAVTASHTVAGARAEEAAAESDVAGTRLEFLPRVTLSGRYTRLSPTDDAEIEGLPTPMPVTIPGALANQWSAGIQVGVPVSDYLVRLPAATAARRHAARAAAAMTEAGRLGAAAGARVAYYEWARVRLAAVVAERARLQAVEHVELARRRLAASSATLADVLLAEARVAEREQLVVEARTGAAVAEKRLRLALGDPGAAPLAIGEDVLAPVAPLAAGDDAVARALAARPELRALAERTAALDEQRRLERARYLPRLDLVGNAAYANPHPRAFPQEDDWRTAWDVSAVLTWSLDDAARGREARRGLDARARAADAERRRAADDITLEVTHAAARVEQATQAIASSARVLAAATEAYRVRKRLYEVGSATSTELGDADTELVRARYGVLDAHIDLRVARALLAAALGR
ncbi:MAG TPA: TolC family protein [Kofleriaceae bacterium]|nr:TolC family protein [Kofleriaceae bacterium]